MKLFHVKIQLHFETIHEYCFPKKIISSKRGTTLEILIAGLATEVWQMTLNFLEKLEKII